MQWCHQRGLRPPQKICCPLPHRWESLKRWLGFPWISKPYLVKQILSMALAPVILHQDMVRHIKQRITVLSQYRQNWKHPPFRVTLENDSVPFTLLCHCELLRSGFSKSSPKSQNSAATEIFSFYPGLHCSNSWFWVMHIDAYNNITVPLWTLHPEGNQIFFARYCLKKVFHFPPPRSWGRTWCNFSLCWL